jgi:microcystin-dependent protein
MQIYNELGIKIAGPPLTPTASEPPGMVAPFAMATPPTGWLKANGAAVSRTTYAALFTAIGTLWGAGDGSTTFNLPDGRGEFFRGFDDGRGVDAGRVFASAQAQDVLSHTHSFFAGVNGLGTNGMGTGGAFAPSATTNTAAAGGAETRPRNIALLVCIKY